MRGRARPGGKSWLTTFLFACLLGNLGIDRFYNGRIGLGIAKLLTNGVCGIWSLIDVVLLLLKRYRDVQGNYLQPAKGGHYIIALSVFAAMIVVAGILAASTVKAFTSEFARMTPDVNLRSEALDPPERLDVQMRLGAGTVGKGASGPAEAFAGFQKAAMADDYSAAFDHLTPESQTELLGMAIAGVGMQKALTEAFNKGSGKKPPGIAGAQREAEAKELKVAAVLKKYGVSIKPGQFSESMIAKVKNKGQCFQDLVEVTGFDVEELTSGSLTGLTVNGDTASGQVDGKTINFKRASSIWLVHLSGQD